MESRAKILGHPIHQMLIPFPLGVLGMSVVFDLIALFLQRHVPLFTAAYYMIAAGIVSGLLAALFGAIDFFAIPNGTRAKRVGAMHGIGNVVVVVLFAASWLLRRDHPGDPDTIAIALSIAAFLLAGVTGWLGGELVDRLSIGVDDGAHPDAPSSLTGRIAR
ncbi:MAG TPA: DUF2231 domain-containing protein [Thermoanaerobaculia bacterium]|jgi:uncharacterized membrane protein|nr:DUF2231 domain-containing protein [Thermoanaerobaculia bacterium]